MNYEETIKYLFDQLPMYQRVGAVAYRKDLHNTIQLANLFNNPEKHFKSIHVGGTNGKGSVSNMLASVLQSAGYKVGLHTSPHLLDFRERIRINGEMINEDEVVDFVQRFINFDVPDLCPSFFEFAVIMAFDYFARQGVDFAIVEVGMGGRLDSTNIISPELSIITNISKDHVAFLGDSIQGIAGEKAGIIKQNTPVVIGESHTESSGVFKEKAAEKDARINFADQKVRIETQKDKINVVSKSFDIILYPDLKGLCQKKNIATVIQGVEELIDLGDKIQEENVKDGLENTSRLTGLRGRWQVLGESPLIICDTAHNEAGVELVVNQLSDTDATTIHIVWGMVSDKEIGNILALLPVGAKYYFCSANVARSLNEHTLRNRALGFELEGNAYSSVKEAFMAAKKNAENSDMIFVGGSTFVVADLFQFIERD